MILRIEAVFIIKFHYIYNLGLYLVKLSYSKMKYDQ